MARCRRKVARSGIVRALTGFDIARLQPVPDPSREHTLATRGIVGQGPVNAG
jgi:hypothetical protein